MVANGSERLLIGKIVGCFGLQGWVKILSHTEPKDNIFSYPKWWLKKPSQMSAQWQECKGLKGKIQGKGLIAQINGVNDRTQAEEFVGLEIYIDAGQLLDLPDGEYYWKDLVGLTVVNEQGFEFGAVSEILATGANDVLIVKSDKAKQIQSNLKTNKTGMVSKKSKKTKDTVETLIPYIWGQVVKKVDLENSVILVDWDKDFLTE